MSSTPVSTLSRNPDTRRFGIRQDFVHYKPHIEQKPVGLALNRAADRLAILCGHVKDRPLN